MVLLADRYYPTDLPDAPVILVRTPYGRAMVDPVQGNLFAERGFQYVVQSVRGTFGSGGEFVPFVAEADDGADTLRWLRGQPWCDGRVATVGASYLGYTQWALGTGVEPVDAVSLTVTASSLREVMWPGGVFGLDVALTWSYLVHHQEGGLWSLLRSNVLSRRDLRRASRTCRCRTTTAWRSASGRTSSSCSSRPTRRTPSCGSDRIVTPRR